ncbi:hypothetical protein EVAR_94304_1 [Eumeta japonica]|uniref:Uncharacterized protein n=1 Tax=Eumeta variegata TaxID=151549 RepID=A0A4C1UF94_EUMVA|nr:hypothetical protein EVAR_94304_1 [Eumeta japonica]
MRHASARSYGDYAESAAPAQTGPALGLFSHARLGGCAVPLLMSCSPNIAAGHLVKSHAYPSYSAPSYRSTEQRINTEAEMKESSNLEEKNEWSEAERSSASGSDMQHMTSISGPHHQRSPHDGQQVFPLAFPQSGIHMNEGMMHHASHI